jgi:hypothetical protein
MTEPLTVDCWLLTVDCYDTRIKPFMKRGFKTLFIRLFMSALLAGGCL